MTRPRGALSIAAKAAAELLASQKSIDPNSGVANWIRLVATYGGAAHPLYIAEDKNPKQSKLEWHGRLLKRAFEK